MTVEQVSIIGGSNGGYAAAGDLTRKGFDVRLYVNTPDHHRSLLNNRRLRLKVSEHYRGPYRTPNTSEEISLSLVTDDMKEAVTGADLVLVPLPTTVQREVYPVLAPRLEAGQTVVLCPGNAGSLLLRRAVDGLDSPPEDCLIGETPTLPYVTRKSGDADVTINLDAVTLPVGAFPGQDSSDVFEKFSQLYDSTVEANNALDCALNNSNVCVNATPTVLNAGVIDNEEFPRFNIHRHGVTERVFNAIMRVDGERVALRKELDYPEPHFTQDNYYTPNESTGIHFYGEEARAALHSAQTFSKDPPSLDSRYIHEDVAINTVLLSVLGEYLGVPTPTINSVVDLAESLMSRDFRTEGRSLQEMGLDGLTRDEFERILRKGFP